MGLRHVKATNLSIFGSSVMSIFVVESEKEDKQRNTTANPPTQMMDIQPKTCKTEYRSKKRP
jgi:hypothetical protein